MTPRSARPRLLVRERREAVPVIDATGAVVGLVDRARLLECMDELRRSAPDVRPFRDVLATALASATDPPPVRCSAGMAFEDACALMLREGVPALLVVRDGQLQGLLTRSPRGVMPMGDGRCARGGGARPARHVRDPPQEGSMATNVFPGFDTTVEKTRAWVHEVMVELERRDPKEAYHALRAALHTLRDHLPIEEVAHLGAQLPLLVRGLYYEGWRPGAARGRDLSPALLEMRRELGPGSDLDPELALRAGLAVIARHVSPGELADVTSALPHRFRALLT